MLENVARRFAVPGRLVWIEPHGRGNVNDTYLAVFRTAFSEQRAVIQRINRRVFRRPEWIMANLRALTSHAHRRLDREAGREDRVWQLPRPIPCHDGRGFYVDGTGGFWRALTHIASATSYDRVRGASHAFETGIVVGQFHRVVSDLDLRRLRDTLPGFHETPGYLERYDATRATKAGARRLSRCPGLSAFVERRRDFAWTLERARQRGELPSRLIHGDPKVSNIMIDDLTGKGTSIVDLDTAKPGLIHYDFGDALRSLCNPAGEEERDLSKVRFDAKLCAAFVKGYMGRARSFLTAADRRYLYDSIRLISFELGLRFLEDFLAGNRYFKTVDEDQNLRRARVQFKLCESVEAQEAAIRRVLSSRVIHNTPPAEFWG